MTDQEYIERVEAALAHGEELRQQGVSEEDIDKWYHDCNEYALGVATAEMVAESGLNLNDAEKQSVWQQLASDYDDDIESASL